MRVPLIDWEPYAPLQPLHLDWLVRAGVEVAVLRLDLIDPLVSGNKWFKLHQPLHAVLRHTQFTALPTADETVLLRCLFGDGGGDRYVAASP